MTNKIKKILKDAWIDVKWKNIGSWVKEDFTNLLEYVESKNVKITTDRKRGDGNLIIRCVFGSQVIKIFSSMSSLERDLYTLIAQNCLYLGDKTKIRTNLGDWSL